MDPNHIKAITNASTVCGVCSGLAQGLNIQGEVSPEVIIRMAGILHDSHEKMRQVVDFLLALDMDGSEK